MYIVSIPEISNEELLERYKRIKPIVEIEGTKYFLRDFKEDELRNISFIWNAKEEKKEPVDVQKIKPIENRDFKCIHKYGYYGLFKPSIAEVLAQIPERDLQLVCAFEIIESPENTRDFAKHQIEFDNGYHVSKVRLYYSCQEWD